jgi:hypothetical protein
MRYTLLFFYLFTHCVTQAQIADSATAQRHLNRRTGFWPLKIGARLDHSHGLTQVSVRTWQRLDAHQVYHIGPFPVQLVNYRFTAWSEPYVTKDTRLFGYSFFLADSVPPTKVVAWLQARYGKGMQELGYSVWRSPTTRISYSWGSNRINVTNTSNDFLWQEAPYHGR